MKNSFRLLAAFGLCATLGTSLVSAAHAAPDAPKMGGRMGGPGMGGPGGRMRGGGGMRGMGRMTKDLNLTDAQKVKIKAMMDASMTQMKAMRGNTSLTPDQKKAKMKTMREANMKKMNAILTPAQRTKMQAMMKERSARRAGGKM